MENDLAQKVEAHLLRKYTTSFHFYRIKQTNQLLEGYPHNQAYQQFCDIRILSDDTQLLKRVYYHLTLTGKPELNHRLKLCADYYAKNSAITYQYPMMVVTNTRDLFMRRHRRIKKIQAGQGSSDETEHHDQEDAEVYHQNSECYLQELNNSNITEELDQQGKDNSFQTQTYDVFGSQIQFQDQLKVSRTLINPKEINVANLIVDLTQHLQVIDNNAQSGLSSYKSHPGSYQMSKDRVLFNGYGKQALGNIQNQPKVINENISIIPIQEGLSLGKQKKGLFGSLGNYLNFMQDKRINYSGLSMKFQNPAVEQYSSNHTLQTEEESLDKQRSQRANRRRKIRQKAEELLKKVRNDEQHSEQEI